MSRPLNLISPDMMRPFLPMYCMIASATVDLPQPELADDADRLARHHGQVEVDHRRNLAARVK